MPIFEYVCASCRRPFEELVLGDESVACPACRSRDVTKKFSTFATSTGASSNAVDPAACGTCGDPRGPGACAMN
jgi:putative FmdB family regulatory protein